MPRKKRELEIRRPEMSVLPESALVRDDEPLNSSSTEPTHEVLRTVPYFLDSRHGDDADGVLSRGTRVTLVRRHANGDCRVRDENGREVYVDCGAIEKVP